MKGRKMSKRLRTNKLYSKIILIFVLVVILILILRGTLARYSSSGESSANVDVAFYLIKEQELSETIKLEEMKPSNEVYTYTFSVANNDGTNRTETALKYTIAIMIATFTATPKIKVNTGTKLVIVSSSYPFSLFCSILHCQNKALQIQGIARQLPSRYYICQ